MGRPRREDEAGAWHHIYNRGTGKRAAFETRVEVRFFLACVAKTVRRGLLELHAFCIMETHFHLLVRSPVGQISEGMRLIENRYVRWFNRRHRREGSLFRGRFGSKVVKCDRYLRVLVRYIDDNPVKAGLVAVAADYPYGSARSWATDRIPPWLCRDWLLGELDPWLNGGLSLIDAYASFAGSSPSQALTDWVERHGRSHEADGDPFGPFIDQESEALSHWMLCRAQLADGARPVAPCLPPSAVETALRGAQPELEGRFLGDGPQKLPWTFVLRGVLLRELCELSAREIGLIMCVSASTVLRRYQMHRTRLLMDQDYLQLCAHIAHLAVRKFLEE